MRGGAGKSGRCRGGLAAALAGFFLLLSAPAGAAALSAADLDLYRQAFRAAGQEHWSEAHALAGRAREPLPAKVLQWLDLTRPDSPASFGRITAFIKANPDWPNQNGLRRQAEAALGEVAPAELRAWFASVPPTTAAGVGAYAEALIAAGEAERAAELVRRHWQAGAFNAEEEASFRARFQTTLRRGDHWARLDRLLWERQEAPARRLVPLVDDGHQALAEARLALASDEPGVEAALRRVPESLAADPGLLYDRLLWRRKKNLDEGALESLAAQPAAMGRPALWWTERHILARRAIERGDYALAYRLARNHGQSETQPVAEAEFLAGWLALRRLQQPGEAFQHFQRLYQAVQSPMSRSRGAYWSGRAAEALGDRRLAMDWFANAARFGTMFYGQLAAAALGGGDRPAAVATEPPVARDQSEAFNHRELVRVVRMLGEIEPGDPADRCALFLRRLIRDADRAVDLLLLSRLALEVNRPDLAIAAAKQAAQLGFDLGLAGYPAIPLQNTGPLEPALVLSVIRQESSFNPAIVSSAGARGLMQLMPATAKLVAGKLGQRHTDARLISDPAYNIQLGSNYLGQLIETYDGSYIMAIAAYNAGLGRVKGWVEKFGDPRLGAIDPLDWIESIPIAETRNYVQRVLEALQVYRLRLGHGRSERSLAADLRR
jgi:soluble lytic murein transglycosylase